MWGTTLRRLAVQPPIEPMLAKLADELPAGAYLYEPKWDGFRAIVFRGEDDVYLQSRDSRPLDRYSRSCTTHCASACRTCVVDGEIVIATPRGLDFDALQLRLHPAASRVAKLAKETPSSFVAFDLLAVGEGNLTATSQAVRRAARRAARSSATPCPSHAGHTRSSDCARLAHALRRCRPGRCDREARIGHVPPGKRAMIKVKHVRTADCVVAGFRWHKSGKDAVGSLLLGLYDESGVLQHAGVTSSFTMAVRRQLVKELAPLRNNAMDDHPWREWADAAGESSRMPGGQSRWSAGKDLSWEPLRIERVCEVKYDHMQGNRFRHATFFLRWRPDKRPQDCRYDQLEVTKPYELERIFSSGSSAS